MSVIRLAEVIANSHQIIMKLLSLPFVFVHILADVQVLEREHDLRLHLSLSVLKVHVQSAQLLIRNVLEARQLDDQIARRLPEERRRRCQNVLLAVRTEPFAFRVLIAFSLEHIEALR